MVVAARDRKHIYANLGSCPSSAWAFGISYRQAFGFSPRGRKSINFRFMKIFFDLIQPLHQRRMSAERKQDPKHCTKYKFIFTE